MEMRISEVNAKLVRHPFYVYVRRQKCERDRLEPMRFQLLKVDRDPKHRLQVMVQSLGSAETATYCLLSEFPDEWILLHEDPMTGEFVHATRSPIYNLEGLIVEHLDD